MGGGGGLFCSPPQNLSMVSLIIRGPSPLCSACLEAERLTARKEAGRNLSALSERRLASARSKCQSLIDLNRIQTRSDFLRSKITLVAWKIAFIFFFLYTQFLHLRDTNVLVVDLYFFPFFVFRLCTNFLFSRQHWCLIC